MAIHYNIAKKQEINPFENVKYVRLVNHTEASHILKPLLDRVSDSVETRKCNDEWVILYHLDKLDFTTLVTWYEPFRGKFYFKSKSIHFRIEDDLMNCW